MPQLLRCCLVLSVAVLWALPEMKIDWCVQVECLRKIHAGFYIASHVGTNNATTQNL